MIGTCSYNCSNKTSDGYCRTTGCINLNYQQNQINQNNTLIFPVTIAGRYFATKQNLLDFVKVHIKAIDNPDYGIGIYS